MLNNVSLIGRITREIELKRSTSGLAVVNFTLAVNSARKDADGNNHTNFIPCTIIGKGAENLVKFCHKGSLIGISGNIESRTYTKKDGTTNTAISVFINNVEYCDKKERSSSKEKEPENGIDDIYKEELQDLSDEDLPF